MGLCEWLAIYWRQRLIPCKPGRVGAIIWVDIQQVAQQRSIILIREICCILSCVCPNFPWYSISDLWRECTVNRSAAINYFSYEESVLQCVSIFLNFPVGNHSFNIFVMWSVWSIMKLIGDWQIRKFKYLRADTSFTFISKFYSKILVSSVNAV